MLERLALEGARDPRVIELARALCRESSYPAWWWLRPMVVVQGLPIVADPPGIDVYQTALETIAHGGDCASKSVLLVALYIAARPYRGSVAPRIVWEHCGRSCPFDHVVVELTVNGARWLVDPLRPLSPNYRAVPWQPVSRVVGRVL